MSWETAMMKQAMTGQVKAAAKMKRTRWLFLIVVLFGVVGLAGFGIAIWGKESTPKQVGVEHNFVKDQYATETIGQEYLKVPTGIATDRVGNVYIADSEKSQIFVFNQMGEHIRTIGKLGNADGELFSPMGLKISNDLLYVADYSNYRIQIFTLAGEVKKVISFQTQDVRPVDIELYKGEIYVTVDSLEALNVKIYKVDSSDKITTVSKSFLGYLGTKGEENIVAVNRLNIIKEEDSYSGLSGTHNMYFLKGNKFVKSKIEFPYKYTPCDFFYDPDAKLYYIICGIYLCIDRFSEDGKYIDTIFQNEERMGLLSYLAVDSGGTIYCTSARSKKAFKIQEKI